MLLILPESSPFIPDLEQAFLLASEELDGHANEDSDGHLGGLDVYVTLAKQSEVLQGVSVLPDIVATPLADNNNARILAEFARIYGAATLLETILDSPESQRFLEQAADPSLDTFEDRFWAELGRTPSAEEQAIYVAARRIGLAVGRLDGAADRNRLQSLLMQ